MGKITGFMETERAQETYASVAERLQHYREFSLLSMTPPSVNKAGGVWIAVFPIVKRLSGQ